MEAAARRGGAKIVPFPRRAPVLPAGRRAGAERPFPDEAAPPPVALRTGPGAQGLRILPGRMIWERVWLADGTPARLCTSLP